MSKKLKLHICIDRIIPIELKIVAATLAIDEYPGNQPRMPRALAGASMHPAKMALLTGKKWQNGRELGVYFMDGSATQKAKVRQFATLWEAYANIRFNFNARQSSAEIRVSFEADDGSWSAVGTDSLHTAYFKKSEPTINFGWLRDSTDDEEWRRVVVHEFGHALGAIHEHQNPKGGIKWNLQAVYDYFSGPPNNWSKADIDHNIVQKYSLDQLNASKFDPNSIMLYSFPPELLQSGVGTASNTKLSTGDKRFIRRMYPKATP